MICGGLLVAKYVQTVGGSRSPLLIVVHEGYGMVEHHQ